MNKVSNYISLVLLNRKIINHDDLDIYQYGLLILSYKLIFCITAIVVSMVMEFNLIYTAFYLWNCFFLRKLTGGYHAKKLYICYLISFVELIFLPFFLYSLKSVQFIYIFIIYIGCTFIIISVSPVDCENKSLNNMEKKIVCTRIKTRCLILTLLFLVLYFIHLNELSSIIVYSTLIITITLRR